MNERIRELVKRAGGYFPTTNNGHTASLHSTDGSLQKFAELIVRECAQVSENDITDGDACCTNTADRIARQIKKHFGVE